MKHWFICGACGGQKRLSDLEPALQAAVSCLIMKG